MGAVSCGANGETCCGGAACNSGLTCTGGAQAFEHQAFMRGVLIDEHEAIGGFGDDVGVGDLASRDTEGVGLRLSRDRRGFFGAALGSGEGLRGITNK
jgi:hypothetical protein